MLCIRSRILVFVFLTIPFFVSCVNGQNHQANQEWLRNEKLAEQHLVLLNNDSDLIPLKNLAGRNIASLNFGHIHNGIFDSLLNKYTAVHLVTPVPQNTSPGYASVLDDLKFHNSLIVQVTAGELRDSNVLNFLREAEKRKSLVIALFGDGTALPLLDGMRSPIVWSQEISPEAAAVTAQAVFGGVPVTSVLDQTYSQKYSAGKGFTTLKTRLKYTVPEEVGIDARDLTEIDEIAAEAIRERATPGGVVMVIKDGYVIFNKAYGNPTYEKQRAERVEDIFDLASITKVAATTMAVMRLSEVGKLNIDTTLSTYIGRTKGTNRENILVKEVMLHQAGFIPFIPFYQNIKPADFRRDSSALYSTKVADNYFIRHNYFKEVMWPQMLGSRLVSRGQYVYSDLSMYYMKEIIEGLVEKGMDTYVLDEFYKPLGMQTAGFNPRTRFSADRIVPTEQDTYFRKTLLHGYVHDQGAAMVGGVSGHAGLFSSTNDLAILFQMLLNKGTYGGESYFEAATVEQFTARQSAVSRRGLGFDRWDPAVSKKYPSELASSQTFGHTGYTGTCVWADPAQNLIYIFLSNRVHPQVTDKLLHRSIRPRIHDVIYRAIDKLAK